MLISVLTVLEIGVDLETAYVFVGFLESARVSVVVRLAGRRELRGDHPRCSGTLPRPRRMGICEEDARITVSRYHSTRICLYFVCNTA